MDNRTRAVGFLVSIAIDAMAAFDLVTRPDKTPVTVLGDIISLDAVLFGVAVGATLSAVIFGWPALVWCWTLPKRRADRKRAQAEQKVVDDREEGRRQLELVVKLLEAVRDQDNDMVNFFDPMRETQAREFAALAQEILQKMGLGLPKQMRDVSENWTTHAARLIPHVTTHGIEHARDQVAEWYNVD